MKDRFTYADFQIYVLPGAYFLFAVLVVAWFLELTPRGGPKMDIFGSAVFLLMSFVFGNFWQAVSHERPEKRLKSEWWDGLYPSQIMFFPNNPVISEEARDRLLNYCQQEDLLRPTDVTSCNENARTERTVVEAVSHAFDILRHSLCSTPEGERTAGAEIRFLFFRGMFVASFWGTVIAVAALVAALVMQIANIFATVFGADLSLRKAIALGALGIVSAAFWRAFRWRCRGAAQGFARDVVLAILAKRCGK